MPALEPPFRKIIHIDMDAFYASIEQRDHPEWRGKPVAVGGAGRRGVVASASYEARRFGVRSAMPGSMARRLCPDLIFAGRNHEVYAAVSCEIQDIFYEFTDLVEPLSLDEAYLDVTDNKPGLPSATHIANAIRQRIFEQTQLTASAGVSFNKFLAKVASDIHKPNGIKVIRPEEALDFLEKLPVEKFMGIGKVTARKMHAMGIFTGGDLRKYSEIELVRRFGKAGRHYFNIVRANDNRPVRPHRIRKSIGAERTFFEDLSDLDAMKEKLTAIAQTVFDYMRKKDNYGRTVTLKIKTHDFKVLTRSKTFQSDIRDPKLLTQIAFELLDANAGEFDKVRLLGISVSNLAKARWQTGIQLSFDFEGDQDLE
ncbi:MAG: DNA polymerase IV [Bacteroidetes bacterium]|nr:MAG: DNA polymerase IV [Bacteroidota bacterium]